VPKSTSQDALARRALLEDIKQDRRGWLQHGAAALAVLGLGVAGSLAATGNAESTQVVAAPAAQVALETDASTGTGTGTGTKVALPSAFDREAGRTTRGTQRTALDDARLKSLADQRAEELSKTDDEIEQAARTRAAAAREKSLESTTKATEKQGARIAREKAQAAADAAAAASAAAAKAAAAASEKSSAPAAAAPAPAPAAAPAASSGKSCMPITTGYSVAARFGQVGSWSRYHTGFDFAAGVGTPLHAPASGVVTNAGSGRASSWAGNYVAIRYPDGTSSLMAHMSTVSVSVGQTVSACQVVGAVGMTGRTFGPHVHFEIYPAGITPGDLYKAVNPVPWLNAHGLRP